MTIDVPTRVWNIAGSSTLGLGSTSGGSTQRISMRSSSLSAKCSLARSPVASMTSRIEPLSLGLGGWAR